MDPIYQEALDRFESLYREAFDLRVEARSTMALATSDAAGNPSVRMVNLKRYDGRGFVFFTNLESGKGRQLAENPRAALCFYWQRLAEQIVIEGRVVQLCEEQADFFWDTRSHEQKVAAWASHQSEPLVHPEDLTERLKKSRAKHQDRFVPRPPYWAGYRVKPDRMEFWRVGWRNVNERIAYQLAESGWSRQVLNP